MVEAWFLSTEGVRRQTYLVDGMGWDGFKKTEISFFSYNVLSERNRYWYENFIYSIFTTIHTAAFVKHLNEEKNYNNAIQFSIYVSKKIRWLLWVQLSWPSQLIWCTHRVDEIHTYICRSQQKVSKRFGFKCIRRFFTSVPLAIKYSGIWNAWLKSH
jgi:hypothetical protein